MSSPVTGLRASSAQLQAASQNLNARAVNTQTRTSTGAMGERNISTQNTGMRSTAQAAQQSCKNLLSNISQRLSSAINCTTGMLKSLKSYAFQSGNRDGLKQDLKGIGRSVKNEFRSLKNAINDTSVGEFFNSIGRTLKKEVIRPIENTLGLNQSFTSQAGNVMDDVVGFFRS